MRVSAGGGVNAQMYDSEGQASVRGSRARLQNSVRLGLKDMVSYSETRTGLSVEEETEKGAERQGECLNRLQETHKSRVGMYTDVFKKVKQYPAAPVCLVCTPCFVQILYLSLSIQESRARLDPLSSWAYCVLCICIMVAMTLWLRSLSEAIGACSHPRLINKSHFSSAADDDDLLSPPRPSPPLRPAGGPAPLSQAVPSSWSAHTSRNHSIRMKTICNSCLSFTNLQLAASCIADWLCSVAWRQQSVESLPR
jgi:hypothetical protein